MRPSGRPAPPAADLFERVPSALLACDHAGCILRINARGAEILGQPAAALVGRTVDSVLAPLDALLDAAEGAEGPMRHTVERPGPDGPRTLGYSVEKAGPQEPLLVLFRDLTDERRLRAERDRLLRMALVGEVLPSVLHELRNPLAAITGVLENLIEEADDDPGLAPHQLTLHAVLQELRRMGLVFQGIGSVGRSLIGDRPAAVDLAIEEAARIMAMRADRRGVRLVTDVQRLPLLPFDLSVVRAVVFNLANNAVQACRPDDAIRVSACLADQVLTLVVRDTGHGMSEAVKAQCFNPFFTTRPNGSGLGLVICREAVQEAGGTLTLESQPDLGTTVTVRVPIPAHPAGRRPPE